MSNVIPEHRFNGGALTIRYYGANPSWHQRKAGHAISSILEVSHTYAEHVAYLRRNPNDTYVIIPNSTQPA